MITLGPSGRRLFLAGFSDALLRRAFLLREERVREADPVAHPRQGNAAETARQTKTRAEFL